MLLVLVLFAALQMASTGDQVSIPTDLKNFKPILTKELEFRIDDCKTGFVGRVVVYQNPNIPNEFIRVYYRQVAIISERDCKNGTTETGGRDMSSSNLNYHRKQETEALGRVRKEADIFAFARWRTERDQRTGEDIRIAGSYRSGLLDQGGLWISVSNSNRSIFLTPVSEPSKADPKKLIPVGIRFDLAMGSHIVRIDQDDLVADAVNGGGQ